VNFVSFPDLIHAQRVQFLLVSWQGSDMVQDFKPLPEHLCGFEQELTLSFSFFNEHLQLVAL
jgi:hypothetical protein